MNAAVFNTPVAVQPAKPFDPHRMPEAVKVPAPVNTRTFLYHADPSKDKNGAGIIIEGKGENDTERIADFKKKLAEKEKLGWSCERQQHGTHPHSNDLHRIEMQTLAAEDREHPQRKYAKESLAVKSEAAKGAPTAEELAIENQLYAERIAKLEAQLEAAKASKK